MDEMPNHSIRSSCSSSITTTATVAPSPPLMAGELNLLVGREAEVQQLQNAYHRVHVASSSPSSDEDDASPSSSSICSEVILIHGESGVGKTKLVWHTFHQQYHNHHMPEVEEDGNNAIMICGKFDVTHHSARPYSAIVDALTDLCQTTWDRIANEEGLLALLERRLGHDKLKTLSKLVPLLKDRWANSRNHASMKIGGDGHDETNNNDPSTSTIDRRQNQFAFSTFTDLVRSFLYLVAGFLPTPLILFLDDVQAADPESRSIISSLTTSHPDARNLLLILSYRDGGGDGGGRVKGDQTLDKGEILDGSDCLRVTDIHLGNLDTITMNQLVSQVLLMDPQETLSLSHLITQRTGGNVFFGIKFLETLKGDSLLEYSYDKSQWEWNLDKIRADTNVTENVASLLTAKIKLLMPHVQAVLQLAACLGFYFDLNFLERISMVESAVHIVSDGGLITTGGVGGGAGAGAGIPPLHRQSQQQRDANADEFRQAIAIAVEENLIDHAGNGKYKFTHDRILQTIYDMIPSGLERCLLHWRIGQALWNELQQQQKEKYGIIKNHPKVSDDWMLFSAADQLNRGSEFKFARADGMTTLEFARLNLEAGKSAWDKSAFKHAAGFLDKGVKLVEGKWQEEYSLCLELYTLSAEAEYAASNIEKCDRRIQVILANARCLDDKLRAFLVKVHSLGLCGRIQDAMYESVNVLQLLGERIPKHPNIFQILSELGKTKRALKGRNFEDFLTLPDMTNSHEIWVTRFLQHATIYSWYAGQNRTLTAAIFRMMQLTMKYGVSSQGPFVLAAYGITVSATGDLETAYEFGKVALELTSRPSTKRCYSSAVAVMFSFLNQFKHPVSDSLKHFLEGYNRGFKSGDIEGAAICLIAYSSLAVLLGKKLGAVNDEMEGFRQAYRDDMDRNFTMMGLTPYQHLVRTMMGLSDDGPTMSSEAFLLEAKRTGNIVAKAACNITRLILFYIMGDMEIASDEVAQCDFYLAVKSTHFAVPFMLMFSSLIMLAMERFTGKAKFSKKAKMFKSILEKNAAAGNSNLRPMLLLISAEQASLQKRCCPKAVRKAYDKAVRTAAESGLPVIEAIGNERAGEYMLSIRDICWAERFLSRAAMLYDEWGAAAKTKQMSQKYSFLESGVAYASLVEKSAAPKAITLSL